MFDLIGYKQYLRRNKKSKNTIKNWCNWLKRLDTTLPTLSKEALDVFLDQRIDTYSTNYLNHAIMCLRTYCKYKNIHPELQKYPFFHPTDTLKATLTYSQIESIINIPPEPGRNLSVYTTFSMFFKFVAWTGARPNEIASLRPEYVDLEQKVFILPTSKTNKPRYIAIPPSIIKDIKNLLSHREGLLFTTQAGNKLRDDNWSREFQRRVRLLGIKKDRLTFYSLRHSFATDMLPKVGDLTLQKLLGHSKLETTQKYVHMVVSDIVQAVKKHPSNFESMNDDEFMQVLSDAVTEVVKNYGAEKRFYLNSKRDNKKLSIELVKKKET